MSTDREIREVYLAELRGPGRLPRISSRVIERAAERQDRGARRVSEVLEVEEFQKRRRKSALQERRFVMRMRLLGSLLGCFLLTVGPSLAGSFLVSWDPYTDARAVGFKVYTRPAGTTAWSTPTDAPGHSTTSATVSGLSAGSYEVAVSAYDAAGIESPKSSPATGIIPLPPLQAPTGAKISNVIADVQTVPPGQIRFSWRTDVPADSRVTIGDRQPVTSSAQVTAHSLTVSKLARRTLYSWRIDSDGATVSGTTRTR